MKVGVLGSGSWGFTLALLLALKGDEVLVWSRDKELVRLLNKKEPHPLFKDVAIPEGIKWTTDIDETTFKKDLILESVTSEGVRSVFSEIPRTNLTCPIVISSKGIEQESLLTLPEVVESILGGYAKGKIALLSGPSFAQEVVRGKPTSVVAASESEEVTRFVSRCFTTPSFRVYPNSDWIGVAFGGAVKNVIAVACGLSDGLKCGASARAALMTRGLHEMRKLAVTAGGKPETLNGLSGMGDLIATCSSTLSRNYSYGKLLAEGKSAEEALHQIGLVVEGAYTCKSVEKLGLLKEVPLPITSAVHGIIYKDLSPMMALQELMQRKVKEEHL
jgi:glycerol-3-phosphate dehydrogenase (NAD(P)+)